MKKHFYFGETVAGYEVPVFNEREVRASAGIMFLFAFISFSNAIYTQNLTLMKIMVSVFLFDFLIRVFVNPRFSPSMILGRWIVSAQKPEYVGAKQKRFAWALGLLMAVPMFFVLQLELTGPATMAVCVICLLFFFLESSFGICVGCKLNNLISKEKATLCPGGTCEIDFKEDIQIVQRSQKIVLFSFLALLAGMIVLLV